MENKKICIAIDTKDKKNNIIRTVNAIKRQTSYENIMMVILYDCRKNDEFTEVDETISAEIDDIVSNNEVVNNINELKQILEANDIENVLFVNEEIILAPNAVEQIMMTDVESDEQLVLNHLKLDTGGNYVADEKIQVSPYCKLYSLHDLFEIVDDDELCVCKNWQLKYSFAGKTARMIDAYAYQIGDMGICVDYKTEYGYIKSIIENEDIIGIGVVTDVIEKALYKAFKESIEHVNEEAYAFLQKCMTSLSLDKTILELELKKYKIVPELCAIMGRCDVSQFRKMYEKFETLADKEIIAEKGDSKLIENLQNAIKNLETRVSCLEQNDYTVEQHVESMYQNGYAVGQYVVSMYQNGKLGMGTIIKSTIAWIKYKLSGKR